jgi:lipooligosaccharide transport system ATP-binding protein
VDVTIRAEGLRKTYGELVAVDRIHFAIRRGECFGFLGPNGAGKTTTQRMIGCASPVNGGRLEVLGLDPMTHGRAIKRLMGVVPQEDNLDYDLTTRENLEVYGRYFDVPRAELRRRVDELLPFVQLQEKAQASVRALSGGMKRRLLVARALVGEPEIVLLDEPTTGLDPQARHLLWERLRLLRSRAKTLVLTTHSMDEAERLCDRLVVMERGRVLDEGSPSELRRRHVARDVVEIKGPARLRGELQGRADPRVRRAVEQEDTLLLYTDEAEGLLHDLTARELPGAELLARRSTLEDVFLELTGRSLDE